MGVDDGVLIVRRGGWEGRRKKRVHSAITHKRNRRPQNRVMRVSAEGTVMCVRACVRHGVQEKREKQ